jgi:hypothetical protein
MRAQYQNHRLHENSIDYMHEMTKTKTPPKVSQSLLAARIEGPTMATHLAAATEMAAVTEMAAMTKMAEGMDMVALKHSIAICLPFNLQKNI